FNNLSKNVLLNRSFHAGNYLLGSLLCLLIVEAISRLVGLSYISDALRLSTTITQGSYEESFTFIVKYLIQVEVATGLLLLIGLGLFSFVLINSIRRDSPRPHPSILLLGITLISVYLAYAAAGFFFNTMVTYGRLLHQYFPFICILSIFSFN